MLPSTSKDSEDLVLPDVLNQQHRLPENCLICEEKAVGFHYNVASCNGCKAFFRRVIITGRALKCSGTRSCFSEAGKFIRKCGKCRFEKCREVGMDPKMIRPDIISEEGKELMEKMMVRNPNTSNELTNMIAMLAAIEINAVKLHNGNYQRDYADLRSLTDILKTPPNFETLKTKELSSLTNQTFPAISGMVHNSFLSVVQYTKSLDFFHLISQEAAKMLIHRNTSLCRNMMLSFYSLSKFRSDIVRRQDGSLSGNPLMNYNGLWVDHREIIQKTLHAMARNKIDEVEFKFLKAIIMCNPFCLRVFKKDQKVVEKQQGRFAKNLLDYCFLQHGRRNGPERFASLMSIVSVMEKQQMNEKSFHIVLRSFHNQSKWLVSPLYDEIMEK